MNTDLFAEIQRLAELSRTRRVWVRVGKIINGDTALPNGHVIFDPREELCQAYGSEPPTQFVPPGVAKPDAILDGITMMPCLVEAHAHMFLEGAPIDFAQREQYLKRPAGKLLERASARWPTIIACGVGAVRDAGDKDGVGLALSADRKAGRAKSPTPYIDSPGAAIHHRGRYGAFMGKPIEDYDSPAECVAARVAEGADRIKLLVSGIINFKVGQVTTEPQMPIEEVKVIVAAAKAHGKQTFAHASGTAGVEHSIEGGVDTVEHGFFITEEQLMKMRDREIAWVPTFAPVQLQIDRAEELGWDETVVGHLKWIIDRHRGMVRRGHEMGVTILAGSDAGSCGVPHGIGLLTEMEHMETAGMPTLGVLNAATNASTEALGLMDTLGGRSRYILTKYDPTETVRNLQKEKVILFDGHAIDSRGAREMTGL
jgi:imidazolonepropionase-like amidohydrolase